MISLKLIKIKEHLKQKEIESEIQHETNQLVILFKVGTRDIPVFVRVYDGEELLQIVAFLPCTTKQETVADTARLLHMLNKEMDTPGFGMDENSSVVFFRIMMPAKDKKVDAQFFDAYINAVQIVCKSFAPVIAAVAYGSVTFDDVLKQSKEQAQSTQPKTQPES